MQENIKIYEKDIFISILIVLTGFLGFGLGRLSKIFENKTPIKIQNAGSLINQEDNVAAGEAAGLENNIKTEKINFEKITEYTKQDGKIYVASKNGTRYYFAWCEGVKKIKEENKIWFKTKEEAEKRGLTPAKNCKGM